MAINGPETQTRLTEQVAEEIRALLARRRMSGRELARRLEASPSWVNFRLTGAQPINLDDLQKIAAVLNVEVTDLLPPAREGTVLTTVGAHTGDQRVRTKGSSHGLTKRTSPIGHTKRTQPDRATHRPARRPLQRV